MRVEEDRRERRIRAWPLQKDDRFSFDELMGLGFKRHGFGLRKDEISGLPIIRAWLGGVDSKVFLKPRYESLRG